MVAGQFAEGEIALCQETFLNPCMAETMQGVQLWIQTHVSKSQSEPPIVFVPLNHREISVAVGNLEHRVTPPTSLLAVDVDQTEHCLDWTEQFVLGSS